MYIARQYLYFQGFFFTVCEFKTTEPTNIFIIRNTLYIFLIKILYYVIG